VVNGHNKGYARWRTGLGAAGEKGTSPGWIVRQEMLGFVLFVALVRAEVKSAQSSSARAGSTDGPDRRNSAHPAFCEGNTGKETKNVVVVGCARKAKVWREVVC
jgi:hypothetical protein